MNTISIFWFGIINIVILSFILFANIWKKQVQPLSTYTAIVFGMIYFNGFSCLVTHWGGTIYTPLKSHHLFIYYSGTIFFQILFIVGYFSELKKNNKKGLSYTAKRGKDNLQYAFQNNTKYDFFDIILLCLLTIIFWNLSFRFREFHAAWGRGFSTFGTVAFVISMFIASKYPLNPLYRILIIFTLVWAVISATLGTGSRQPLFGVLIGYFLSLVYSNNKKKISNILILLPFCLIALHVLASYSTVRRTQLTETGFLTTKPELLLENLKDFNPKKYLSQIGDNTPGVSIASIWFSENSHKSLFHSFKMFFSFIIPRAFWEDKPIAYGTILPRDLGIWYKTGYVNWGPGIVGHAVYDGSILFVILYAWILKKIAVKIDRSLTVSPNPLKIGYFAAAFPYFMGWIRGDISVFSTALILIYSFYILSYKAKKIFYKLS